MLVTGSMVAIVTPMHSNGAIDYKSFKTLIDIHLEANTQAIVVAGTTGESPTLTLDEKKELLTLALTHVEAKIPIIMGTGTNATHSSIELSQIAQAIGANGLLIVTPYYNKPTQAGLIQHFTAISNAVTLPIFLYNVPSRTGCDLLPETIGVLSQINNIVGVKEATGQLDRVEAILKVAKKGFKLYSGDDLTALDFMSQGGHGVISVTANVAPQLMQKMCLAIENDDRQTAISINKKLIPLHHDLFIESNPIPTKWILNKLGLIPDGIRLPLTPLTQSHHATLEAALLASGVNFL